MKKTILMLMLILCATIVSGYEITKYDSFADRFRVLDDKLYIGTDTTEITIIDEGFSDILVDTSVISPFPLTVLNILDIGIPLYNSSNSLAGVYTDIPTITGPVSL